ncbi:hypothetical protein [Intrasporangium sp.]|uniref:hypothetical protein n=1 Tax=Intrasporangium sp. TaxID=1925024 RepID=UPI003221D2DD
MMLVDCSTCPVREVRCADCLVTALDALPAGPEAVGTGAGTAHGLPLDHAERRAVAILLSAGLLTPAVARAAEAVRDPRGPRARAGHGRAVG